MRIHVLHHSIIHSKQKIRSKPKPGPCSSTQTSQIPLPTFFSLVLVQHGHQQVASQPMVVTKVLCPVEAGDMLRDHWATGRCIRTSEVKSQVIKFRIKLFAYLLLGPCWIQIRKYVATCPEYLTNPKYLALWSMTAVGNSPATVTIRSPHNSMLREKAGDRNQHRHLVPVMIEDGSIYMTVIFIIKSVFNDRSSW